MIVHLLLSLIGCGGSTPSGPQPDAEAAAEVARTFCTLVARAGLDCAAEGPTARFAERTFAFSVTSDRPVSVPGQAMLQLHVEVEVDGVAVPLGVPVLGAGRDDAAAREKAANDWNVMVGAALADRFRDEGRLTVLQAIQDERQGRPVTVHAGWRAYPGWVYLAGRQAEREPLRFEELLGRLEPMIAAWPAEAGATRTAYVELHVRPGFATEPTCLLDGRPDEALCAAALRYPWPEPGSGGYLLKQFVALTPAPGEE